MIHFAMELPTAKLGQWSHLADFDFVLAHKVLSDPAYAAFFRDRPAGREVLLDNSYHELGYPLSTRDLGDAARMCNADYVITPDKVGDIEFNREQYLLCAKALKPEFKLAVVMTSPRPAPKYDLEKHGIREQFLIHCLNADMLCCTFKDPDRFALFSGSPMAHRWKRIHLLGMAEPEELQTWTNAFGNDHRYHISIDTGKALKWALRGKKMDEIPSVRSNTHTTEQGLPSEASQYILDIKAEDIPAETEELLKHNVQYIRRLCGAPSDKIKVEVI